eukprot:4243440-Alexandrium_andersonii.AAC.1
MHNGSKEVKTLPTDWHFLLQNIKLYNICNNFDDMTAFLLNVESEDTKKLASYFKGKASAPPEVPAVNLEQ